MLHSPIESTTGLPTATSLTHQHLLAVINTRLGPIAARQRMITICDIGCGEGGLIAYLAATLPLLWPGNDFRFFGLETTDAGVQVSGFYATTIANLQRAHPGTAWGDRVHTIASGDPWPFGDGSIDILTSNQVLEHVFGHDQFMAESRRVLSDGGIGIHLFPLRHVLWEDHVKLPLAHKIRQHDLLRRYLKGMSYLGLGIFKSHNRAYGHSRDYYAEEHADFLVGMTNYRSGREMLAHAKAAKLRASFAYTLGFYTALLRRKLRLRPAYVYREQGFVLSLAAYLMCRYISSVTLTVEKKQIYRR
jgi:SAM-dependent methyltransferase